MLAATQGGDDITQALLAVGGAQDVIDAGHDGGDVGDVAAVVHGGCNDNGDQMMMEIIIFQLVSGMGVSKMLNFYSPLISLLQARVSWRVQLVLGKLCLHLMSNNLILLTLGRPQQSRGHSRWLR